ncbi:type IV secretion system protein [Acidiphilium sp. AL]|uniref:type IV secretion system protein n=1 Tax=Acidiphilium sp. AL TaxID=2871704 RepID=UPI0021CB0188|nr:type IV secretion system protein [Acidiphilium sp. AL]MCU4162114.1 type IV secretion system protein [Acidiphilium sp. AL]
MKPALFACVLVSAGVMLEFGMAPNAAAQMAVIDSANLGQNIQTAAQSVIAVEQLKAQLAQLEQTYQMFTNSTNILGMAAGMENLSIENPMPMANAMAGLVGGSTAPSGAAASYFNQNHVYTPTDSSAASSQLNANGNAIANIEGIASTNLAAIQQRMQELPNLESDLSAATSITQVDAINGRIAAESQFVQAQQAQAQNLQVLANEQALSQQQQQQEQFDKDQINLVGELQADAAANGGQ